MLIFTVHRVAKILDMDYQGVGPIDDHPFLDKFVKRFACVNSLFYNLCHQHVGISWPRPTRIDHLEASPSSMTACLGLDLDPPVSYWATNIGK